MKTKLLLFNIFTFISGLVFSQTGIVNDSIYKFDLPKNAECFSKGLENKYNENYDAAINYFEEALKFNNDDDASMYELSELYQLKNKNTKAYSMIYNAVKLQPDNKWYQIRLAEFYINNSDYNSAIKIYDKLLVSEPNNLDYLQTYINALIQVGDVTKVLEKLDVLESITGENEIITLQRVEIYKTKGDTKNMISEMEKLVNLAPENTRYLAMLAQLYTKNNRDDEGYNLLLKIKEIDPEDKYINISLYDYYQTKGEIEKAFNEFVSAIKNPNLDYDTKVRILSYWMLTNANSENSLSLTDLETIGMAFIEIYPDKYMGYNVLGTMFVEKKEYKNAQEYFQISIDKEKNNYASYYQICLIDLDLKEYDILSKHAKDAIEIFPEQPIFYLFSGLSYYESKDYENTIKYLEKGRKLSANKDLTKDFDTYLGDAYNQLNDRKKSYEAYDRVLKVDPDNIYILNNYAYYLSLDNQQLEKALAMSAKTIKAEPKNATYLDTYAWVLYKMGRFQEAKKWMEKVFKYEKKPNGVNYEHLGDILFKLGDKKGALHNWKKAQKCGDSSEFIDGKIKTESIIE